MKNIYQNKICTDGTKEKQVFYTSALSGAVSLTFAVVVMHVSHNRSSI